MLVRQPRFFGPPLLVLKKPVKRVVFVVAGIWLLIQWPALSDGGILSLELTNTSGWRFVRYSKIPPNVYRPTPSGLEVAVTNSAAPAIFPLTNGVQVTELRASGKIVGLLNMPSGKQGEQGFDDYTVRIGLVESGPRKLTWFEKRTAPNWVKTLFALAPRGTGIRKIHFFNVGSSAEQIGTSRIHPTSELMRESVVAVPDEDGRFSLTQRFADPIHTIAVWISCDGDDTKSAFTVTLSAIELVIENGPVAGPSKN